MEEKTRNEIEAVSRSGADAGYGAALRCRALRCVVWDTIEYRVMTMMMTIAWCQVSRMMCYVMGHGVS